MKNRFNCVDMKHKGAEIIQEKIKGYSVEEELKYWANRSAELKSKKERIVITEENISNPR